MQEPEMLRKIFKQTPDIYRNKKKKIKLRKQSYGNKSKQNSQAASDPDPNRAKSIQCLELWKPTWKWRRNQMMKRKKNVQLKI